VSEVTAAGLARLGRVLQFSVDGIVLTSPERGILYASPSFETLLGYAPEEVVGRSIDELIHPEDQPAVEALTRQVLAHEASSPTHQCRVRHADGRWLLIEGRVRNLLADPAVGALVAFFRDVTPQDVMEQALRASEQRYRRLVNDASDIIFQCDADGLFSFVNPTVSAVMQYSEVELLGRHFTELVRPDYRERLVALYQHQSDQRSPDTYIEFPAIAKDGTEVWIGQHVQIVLDGDRLVGLQAVARDITERLRFEEQLNQAQRMEAIGTLAGGVAHDFNNLLQTIRGNAEVAIIGLTAHEPRSEMREILQACDRAESLVRQLLAFGQRQPLRSVVLDLRQGIDAVCASWDHLLGSKIRIGIHCDPGVRPVRVDPVQFEQVLANLILNARDAMPAGGRIEIDARNVDKTAPMTDELHATLAGGPFVQIAVTDTGVGMSAGTLERIFEPFFTTKEPGRGTGLGLSSAYGIVAQSGGHIDVMSHPGGGSRFTVYLPAVAPGPDG
jgi:PAS domain S-box-containing protein